MPKNVAASIYQKLLNRARETGRPFDELLQYYAMERFLYRLSQSEHANSFILKGALLFRIWDVPDSRATRDMDFLAFVVNTTDELTRIVQKILTMDVPDDGLAFDFDSVSAVRIKEDADYEGVRITFRGQLGNARLRMQVDVAFGDVVHPEATEHEYPVMLGHPTPVLRSYPPETVIAEKLEAMIHLGALNSRMKDFYDVWRLSRQQDFVATTLSDAITQTLANRKTEAMLFDDLAKELLDSDTSRKQWAAFLRKTNLDAPDAFSDLLAELDSFVGPVLNAVLNSVEFDRTWNAPGPWRTTAL
jgi:predicted nucleotidyltransferase component of viral defense system